MASSVYIHIPFCRSICSYCDFSKIYYKPQIADLYLDKLKLEIEDAYGGEKIKTLYIGGGTPSALNREELLKLNDIITIFNLDKDYEFTFECNIEDINESLLKILKIMGVNRLSVGIESFNQDKLKFMNRKVTFEEAKDKVALIRKFEFNNLNLDLMYGIPGEKLRDTKNDLKEILKLNPEHISTYSLIIEDHTICKNKHYKNIDPALEVRMYEYIENKLAKKGYVHYEVSNFAKPGYESKHNLVYWDNNEYYGFGLGASGYIEGFRYENTRNIQDYVLGKYKLKEDLIGKKEDMDNEIMLGLRKMKGINIKEFFDKYDINIQDAYPIEPLVRDKELMYKDGYVYINPKYIYVMNEILLKLI